MIDRRERKEGRQVLTVKHGGKVDSLWRQIQRVETRYKQGVKYVRRIWRLEYVSHTIAIVDKGAGSGDGVDDSGGSAVK